jgi:hypothetical protein
MSANRLPANIKAPVVRTPFRFWTSTWAHRAMLGACFATHAQVADARAVLVHAWHRDTALCEELAKSPQVYKHIQVCCYADAHAHCDMKSCHRLAQGILGARVRRHE